MRPVDLARAVGVSAQTIRKYEKWGFLPPAERSENGYRQYGPRHLAAIRAADTMKKGFGFGPALRILRRVNRDDLTGALALVDARYALLHQERTNLEQTLAALKLTAAAASMPPRKGRPAVRYVGDVAEEAGVEVSAVRFWEQKGLLEPRRDPESGYRVYDDEQALRVLVIAGLRRAGYAPDAIRPVLDGLAAGRPEQAVAAAERRLATLAETSRSYVAASAALQTYLEEIGL